MDNIRNVIGCRGRRPDAGRAVRRLAGRARVHAACSSATRRSRTCRESSTSASAAAPSTARTPSRRTWRLTPAIEDGGRTDASRVQRRGRRARWDRAAAGSRRRSTSSSSRRSGGASAARSSCSSATTAARGARNRARLSFLLESWGVDRFRRELEQRVGRPLERAGRDARIARERRPHRDPSSRSSPDSTTPGLLVAVGRARRRAAARRRARGRRSTAPARSGFTTSQNIIIPNVPDAMLAALHGRAAARRTCRTIPHGAMRGLVACTGHRLLPLRADRNEGARGQDARDISRRGCPTSNGSRRIGRAARPAAATTPAADIGLLGKNIRVNGEMVEAVDVFIGGRAGPNPKAGIKMLEDVPCDDLPAVLETLIPYVTGKRAPVPTPWRRACAAAISGSCERLAGARSRCSRAARPTNWRPWWRASAARRSARRPSSERPTAHDAGPLLARIIARRLRMVDRADRRRRDGAVRRSRAPRRPRRGDGGRWRG